MARITQENSDLRITIEGESTLPFAQDLYTRAVIKLISEADTDGWGKHHPDGDKTEELQEHFCALILAAVTLRYSRDAPSGQGEEFEIPGAEPITMLSNKTLRELLLEMLDHFSDNSILNTRMREIDLFETGNGDKDAINPN